MARFAERPSIGLVAHGLHDRGGMERYLAELVRQGSSEVDFHLVATDVDPTVTECAVSIRRIRVPKRPVPVFFSSFYAAAGPAVRRLDVDLVHAMGAIQPHPVDVISVQFCHAAFARLSDDDVSVSGGRLRQVNRSIDRALSLAAERRAYARGGARLYLPASTGVRDELREHYAIDNTAVIPNGFDPTRFASDRATHRAQVLDEIRGTTSDVVAVFLGGDWVRKGLRFAIEGLADAVVNGAHDLRLVVVGRGDSEFYGALASRLGVGDRVNFVGPSPAPERYLMSGDLFVFPTAYEAFPLVAIEAAAAGLPLVATSGNGVSDLIDHEQGGLFVERDGRSVGRAMLTLARSADLRRAMGDEARRRASSFTWQASVDSTLDAYASLLPHS